MEEARALNAPPTVAVTVVRETRPAGGAGGCASPVCVVLLPVLLWSAVFPPDVDVIDIREESGASVHGEWEPDGDLLWAERREGGVVRAARLLDLPVLGRRLVVEGGRAPVLPDGTTGQFAPTAVQSQLDLVGAYRTALELRSGQHADLLAEALQALGAESRPLLLDWLARPDEGPARARILAAACGVAAEPDTLPLREAVLHTIAPLAEPEVAAAGLRCALATPSSTDAPLYASHIVAHVCRTASTARTSDLRELSPDPAAQALLEAAIPACASPTRRTLMRRAAALPVTDAELLAIVERDPDASAALVPYLHAAAPGDRVALFAQLRSAAEAGPIVERLNEDDALVPTAPEAEALVGAYLAYAPSLLGRRDPQGVILALLSRALPPDRGPALARLAAFPADDRPVEIAAAALVLGDRSRGPFLADSRRGAECMESDTLVGTGELAARALGLAGCTCEDFDAMARGKGERIAAACPAR